MKRMKKILAVLLAAIMVMSLGTSVFADVITATEGDVTVYYEDTTDEDGNSIRTYYSDADKTSTTKTVTTTTDGTVTTVVNNDNGTKTTTVTYTVTVSNGKDGHTYEAYQIFTGTLDSTGGILSDVQWGNGISSSAFLQALKNDTTVVGKDDNRDVTFGSLFTSCTTAAEVAEALTDGTTTYGQTVATIFAQIASENLSTTVAGKSTETTSPYTISGLSAGYYLVKDKDNSVTANDDAYTDVILKVVSSVSVNVKSVYPTVSKSVSDTDASVGDTLTFTITATVPDTSTYSSYTYIISDTLSAGLTYVTGSLKVKAGDSDLTADTDYTLTVGDYNSSTGTAITVTMKNAVSLSQKSIVVTYDATLNSNAVSGSTGNTNTVKVTYSNNPNWDRTGDEPTGTTTESKTTTFTYNLDITKVDGDDAEKTLEGVTFVLKNSEGKYYQKTTNSDGNVTITWVDSVENATVLTTDTDGGITVSGLDVGTYYLTEKSTLDGYNLLTSDVKIVISAEYNDADSDGKSDTIASLTVTVDEGDATASTDEDKSSVDVTVKNYTGSTLPTTGGMGTTIFYVVGAILVLGAAVILVTRRRMASR